MQLYSGAAAVGLLGRGRCWPPRAGLLDSAVDECPVVEVRLGQDVALLLVLQHVGPRLAIALFEQDVLRAPPAVTESTGPARGSPRRDRCTVVWPAAASSPVLILAQLG